MSSSRRWAAAGAPTSTCRCSTRPALAPSHAPLRRRRPFPRQDRRYPAEFPGRRLRSSFIIGYPGETEEDHDALLAFLEEAELDWVGFFAFSNEEGTYAAGLAGQVPSSLVAERTSECSEVQDAITARRAALPPGGHEVPGPGRRPRPGEQPPGSTRHRRHHPGAAPLAPVRGSIRDRRRRRP